MNTEEFLRHVLPSSGYIFVACIIPTEPKGSTTIHFPFNEGEFDEAAKKIIALDKRKKDTFFALGTRKEVLFNTTDKGFRHPVRGKADNVKLFKSLWLDIDVGKPDKKVSYDTQRDALRDVAKLCKAVDIPPPLIVSSGMGLHCYWPLETEISVPTWSAFAKALRAACDHIKVKHDASCTTDANRVLRPINTTNYKYGLPVKLLGKVVGPYSLNEIGDKLLEYVKRECPSQAYKENDNDAPDWVKPIEFPPSSTAKIARKCAALRHVILAGGNVLEPYWRAMCGLVKYTTEGEPLAHKISAAGYPDYKQEECQAKLDNWKTGPTTCGEFSKHTDVCQKCEHWGKIKSPIVLGYVEPETPQQPKIDPPHGSVATPHGNILVPKGFRWDGQHLSKYIEDEDGVGKWYRFCNTFYYISMRVMSADGSWSLRVHSRERNGQWREFDLPTEDVAAPDTLAKTLAKYEVFMEGSKSARQYGQDYIRSYIAELQARRVELTTYSAFGWTKDGNFIIGNKQITPDGVKEILLTEDVFSSHKTDFGISGTTEEWAELVDRLVNRPNAEPFQLAMCAAFAAPLIEVIGRKDWHGIPIAFVGKGGEGKTTMTQVACSAFGNGDFFLFNAGNSGMTANARIAKIAMMRNLPFVMDEISGIAPKELGELMYAMANGRPKDRLTTTGKPVASNALWNTIPFITSNESPIDILSKLDQSLVDPTALRVFEIRLTEDYLDRVYDDLAEARNVLIKLSRLYGSAGRDFLRWVMNHREKVVHAFNKLDAKYNARNQEEARERFYTYLITTATVAGLVAKKLGILRFDVEKMAKWAFDHVKSLRAHRRAVIVDLETQISQFISELHGRLIVTKYFADARNKHGPEKPIAEPAPGSIWGRLALEDKRLIISYSVLRNWCLEKRISPIVMRREMDKLGYLVVDAEGNELFKTYLGRGTNIPTGQSVCLELNFSKVCGMTSLHLVPNTDVVEKTA